MYQVFTVCMWVLVGAGLGVAFGTFYLASVFRIFCVESQIWDQLVSFSWKHSEVLPVAAKRPPDLQFMGTDSVMIFPDHAE